MKTEKAIIDGVEKDIVIELDEEFKDDTVINNINLEDTLEIPIEKINEISKEGKEDE